MPISKIFARQIFDSRGFPTVECDVIDGSLGRAVVPSGASTGSREAVELRDGGMTFNGKGVSQAVANINQTIAPALIGLDSANQQGIDERLRQLDGTDNKNHLGANALLAVSLAVAKAAAAKTDRPLYEHVAALAGFDGQFSLPMPMLNILNGGKHADGSTDIQEFMIVPAGARDFAHALQISSEIYHQLGTVLRDKNYATTVGDEGGYAPAVKGGSEEALELIGQAVAAAGYGFGNEVMVALDVAASELYEAGSYEFRREKRTYATDQLIAQYAQLSQRYPLVSLEDGLDENDWAGWSKLTQQLGDKLQLVGDDLLVTNTKLLQQAIESRAANAILIKPNQIGTLSETIAAVQMAQTAGWRTVMSHRSGETEDVTIAHLAVGLNTGQIKTGSFTRSDRVAKYNELLRISEQLKSASLARPFNSGNL